MALFAQLWPELQAATPIITVNRRLARHLLQHYYEHCRQQAMAWPVPLVEDLASWFVRQLALLGEPGRLLSRPQQQALWQQVIRDDAARCGLQLLQLGATAEQAMAAHRLSCAYGLVGRYAPARAEEQAFVRWQQAYLVHCRQQDWLDEAALPPYLCQAFAAGRLTPPERLVLAGFDEMAPDLHQLCDQLRQCGCQLIEPAVAAAPPEPPRFRLFDSLNDELTALVDWAAVTPGRRLIVVPRLEALRQPLNRALTRRKVAANLSLGRPLSQFGPIQTALRFLSVQEPLARSELSYLLRSPFLAGGCSQREQRVRADLALRQARLRRADCATCVDLLRRQPVDTAAVRLAELLAQQSRCRERLPCSAWAGRFSAWLEQAGWPGERALDSATYQLLESWQEKLLPALCSLDRVLPVCDRRQALAWLEQLADQILFQPEAADEPVQVVGLLESAGLQADALWVMGLHDQELPAALDPQPFLPRWLQQRLDMPRASQARELRFARQQLQRLAGAASTVCFSCSRRDSADEAAIQRRPSPLLQLQQPPLPEPAGALAAAPPVVALECQNDSRGLPLVTAGDPARGGAALLRDQAHCPFKAYARHRLGLRALEEPAGGFDARQRGTLIHRLLQEFWQQLGSSVALLHRDENACRQLLQQLLADLASSAAGVWPDLQQREFWPLEADRLLELALQWLMLERQRGAFSVEQLEQACQVSVGPLQLRLICDRLDRSAAGSVLVIDYKTARSSARVLQQLPLLEPQLPLYALYAPLPGPVAGVAFAQLRPDDCRFAALGTLDDLPGVEPLAVGDWRELCEQWRDQIEALAQAVADGAAAVQPAQPQVCRNCDLQPLCRITLRDQQEGNDAEGC